MKTILPGCRRDGTRHASEETPVAGTFCVFGGEFRAALCDDPSAAFSRVVCVNGRPVSSEGAELRDRFLAVLLEAARPLQTGADPEVALEAMIEAAELLRDRLGAGVGRTP